MFFVVYILKKNVLFAILKLCFLSLNIKYFSPPVFPNLTSALWKSPYNYTTLQSFLEEVVMKFLTIIEPEGLFLWSWTLFLVDWIKSPSSPILIQFSKFISFLYFSLHELRTLKLFLRHNSIGISSNKKKGGKFILFSISWISANPKSLGSVSQGQCEVDHASPPAEFMNG